MEGFENAGALWNSLSTGIVLYKGDGTFLFANEPVFLSLGIESDQDLRQHPWGLFSYFIGDIDQHTSVEKLMNADIDKGVHYRRVCRLRNSSGHNHHLWFEINVKRLPHQGEHLFLIELRDVTEFVEAQSKAKIGSWNFDLRTRNLRWSSEHYRIFEIPEPQPPEKLYQLYRDRIHPDDIVMMDQVIERAMGLGEDFVYNHRVYLDGGSRIKHVRGIGYVSRDHNGKPFAVSGTCQDLTDIVELQEQQKFILKSTGLGIWKLNVKTQQLIWDQSMYDLYGLSPSQFNGHYDAWESSLSSETKAEAIRALQDALADRRSLDTTFEIIKSSGEKRDIGARGIVVRNADGEPTMVYGVNWDRTQETRAQQELEKSRRLLQDIIEAAPSKIFVRDLAGKVLICNQSYARVAGWQAHEMLGCRFDQIYSDQQIEQINAYDRDAVSSGRSVVFENELLVNGIPRLHLESHFPLKDEEGRVFAIGGIVTDIQETKELRDRYEKELELERTKLMHNSKLASLGEMAAGVAHEVNNPLAVIIGTIPALEKTRGDEERFKKKCELMQRSAERIERIVNGLRKFARVSDKPELKVEPVKAIVAEALILAEARAKRAEAVIHVELEEGLVICCDQVEIEQVLINLVNNGLDAVKGQRDRWVKIEPDSKKGQVCIRVIDSGSGITPEIEGKLFQPFFTTKPVGEGTGLGLSIVKGILDHHGARIGLNRDFKETCFEIEFPVCNLQHEPDKP